MTFLDLKDFFFLRFQIKALPAPVEPSATDRHHLRKLTLPATSTYHPKSASAGVKQRSKSHMHHPVARSINDSLCSRINPIEDDLILKIGSRGRNKGEFTNPQGIAASVNGKGGNFV